MNNKMIANVTKIHPADWCEIYRYLQDCLPSEKKEMPKEFSKMDGLVAYSDDVGYIVTDITEKRKKNIWKVLG